MDGKKDSGMGGENLVEFEPDAVHYSSQANVKFHSASPTRREHREMQRE
jgi:hypothetical protein